MRVFPQSDAAYALKHGVLARDTPPGGWRDDRAGRTVDVQANRARTLGFGPCADLLLMVPNLAPRGTVERQGPRRLGVPTRGFCASGEL
jgi:hypothetical protein